MDKKFNTASSKTSSNKLNVSCETAEFSASQLAQPQPHPLEMEDFFPPAIATAVSSSPVLPRRRPMTSSSQRASFSANNSSTSPVKSAAGNLLRKASFRSPIMVPQKTCQNEEPQTRVNNGVKAKAYESLKSQGSTGSTGSKASTNSSVVQLLDLDEHNSSVPDTEDPDLLNQLSFVSPKAGVYRPVNPPNNLACNGKMKDKDKCILM